MTFAVRICLNKSCLLCWCKWISSSTKFVCCKHATVIVCIQKLHQIALNNNPSLFSAIVDVIMVFFDIMVLFGLLDCSLPGCGEMGIKQLGKFLKSNCPSAMSHHSCASDYKAPQCFLGGGFKHFLFSPLLG